jgi:hypothetical protein
MRVARAACYEFCPCSFDLSDLAQVGVAFCVAFCARLGDSLEAFGDFFVKHMRISERVPDVGVIEHSLHELQVARLAQRLGCHVMPEIMKPEAGDASQ